MVQSVLIMYKVYKRTATNCKKQRDWCLLSIFDEAAAATANYIRIWLRTVSVASKYYGDKL